MGSWCGRAGPGGRALTRHRVHLRTCNRDAHDPPLGPDIEEDAHDTDDSRLTLTSTVRDCTGPSGKQTAMPEVAQRH